MKKRFVTFVLSAALALSCAAMLASCGGKYSETFNGALSAQTYTSAEEAAVAFLENEISGNTVKAEFVGLEVKSELSEKQIKALALSDDDKSGLSKVEEITITYRERTAVASLAADSADAFTQRAYLLTYEDGAFRYFVPQLENGENLTKSYFEDVFDASKYLNVTYDFKCTAVDEDGMTTDWDALAKINENAVYEKDEFRYTKGEETETKSVEMYMGLFGERYVSAEIFSGSDWDVNSEVYDEAQKLEWAETLREMGSFVLRRWFGAAIDYTYFVKTDSGFALRSDKLREFIYAMTQEEFDEKIENFSAEYSVFVSQGKISNLSYKFEYGNKKGSYQIECSDYGKTEISLPAEVQSQIF